MALIKCEHCNKDISDKAKKCVHCSASFEDYGFCEDCGKKLETPECPDCAVIVLGKRGMTNFSINSKVVVTIAIVVGVILLISTLSVFMLFNRATSTESPKINNHYPGYNYPEERYDDEEDETDDFEEERVVVTGILTSNQVFIRGGPSTTHSSITRVDADTRVTLVERTLYPDQSTREDRLCTGGWYHIYLPNSTTEKGYVCSQFLRIEQ